MQNKVIQLRQHLAERLPQARFGFAPERPPAPRWPTGVPGFDAALGGGLPRGGFTELVGAGDGSGSAQVLHALLDRTARDGRFLTLVDGVDSFDATAVEQDTLAHLLWVRCRDVGEALKAADLVLRDRNLPLVVLDLKLNPPAELRRLTPAVWYRLGRLLEQNGATALVVTPAPLVSGAGVRVEVAAGLGAGAMHLAPGDLAAPLRFRGLRTAGGEHHAALARAG